MNPKHPINPPYSQIDKWKTNRKCGCGFEELLIKAAQWGADQELEACCEWVCLETTAFAADLQAARRPKPLSLKQRALKAARIELIEGGNNAALIFRALESIPDSE